LRIRIIQKPERPSIDGIRLDRFQPGLLYEVGTSLGTLLLCEGWAEPIPDDDPALLLPLKQPESDTLADVLKEKPGPRRLLTKSPSLAARLGIAADAKRRKRTR
jgi:hypothetical protein